MKAIVTGAAGFIGFHTTKRLLDDGWTVVGIDNLNDYYPIALKKTRLLQLQEMNNFRFVKADISDAKAFSDAIGQDDDSDIIIHLAAQAGVKYSVENPSAYITSNVSGQVVVFEQALKMPKKPPVVYASSSSVYGANTNVPFSEDDRVDHPVSVYAATKRMDELLAHSYGHIHGLKTTGLRFFTVYGPFGRPDMAPWLFSDAIACGRPIKLFNFGKMQRDFTYVDDIVGGIASVCDLILTAPEKTASVYNLGNNKPITLTRFVDAIEKALDKKAIVELHPLPPADVVQTYADITRAQQDFGFLPQTSIDEGMKNFVDWFIDYNKIK